MNWKQQIKAQIADLYPEQFEQRESMQALLDVAVAAERANEYIRDLHGLQYGPHYLEKTLDKLREVK